MHKSIRPFIPVVLVATLALSACGSDDGSNSAQNVPQMPAAVESSAPPVGTSDDHDPVQPAVTQAPPVSQDGAAPQGGAIPGGPLDNEALLTQTAYAMNVALQAVPGSVVAIEHDFWDVPEWNVHILPTGAYGPVEVKIHEGSVIGTEPSDDDDFVNPQGVSFSIEAAIKAAMDLTKGQFDSAELKLFNGAPMWVVDMDASSASGDVKVVVNPATGEAMVYSD